MSTRVDNDSFLLVNEVHLTPLDGDDCPVVYSRVFKLIMKFRILFDETLFFMVYLNKEKIWISFSKPFISFIGNQTSTMIISWNDKAYDIDNSTGLPIGTNSSAFVAIKSAYFHSSDITFEVLMQLNTSSTFHTYMQYNNHTFIYLFISNYKTHQQRHLQGLRNGKQWL